MPESDVTDYVAVQLDDNTKRAISKYQGHWILRRIGERDENQNIVYDALICFLHQDTQTYYSVDYALEHSLLENSYPCFVNPHYYVTHFDYFTHVMNTFHSHAHLVYNSEYMQQVSNYFSVHQKIIKVLGDRSTKAIAQSLPEQLESFLLKTAGGSWWELKRLGVNKWVIKKHVDAVEFTVACVGKIAAHKLDEHGLNSVYKLDITQDLDIALRGNFVNSNIFYVQKEISDIGIIVANARLHYSDRMRDILRNTGAIREIKKIEQI
jgi:hypothetical protein